MVVLPRTDALVLSVLLLGVSVGAPAAQVQTSVSGNLGAVESYCLSVFSVLSGQDCSYAGDRPASLGWGGPIMAGAYYQPGSSGDSIAYFPPNVGDQKIAPLLTGSIRIDDGGTAGVGTDDSIAADLVIGPAARNITTGNGRHTVERWSSINHTLLATTVNAATPNAQGGFDYVIGLHGFPQLLCSATIPGECFGSEYTPVGVATASPFWAGPEASGIGIERNANQGGNVGAETTATLAGYSCVDNSSGEDCTTGLPVWGAQEDPGFDNLLLRIVTNAAGQVVAANGFWTQEFRVSGFETQPGDNSWYGGTLSLGAQAVPLPASAWLLATAFGVVGWRRRR